MIENNVTVTEGNMFREPNFLFIGAARCASTWTHECLKEHPEVLVPETIKEVNFFNRDQNYQKGLEWYHSFFTNYKNEKAIGEVTPTYFCDPKSAERIYNHYPNVKLIICLRNPVVRAYSSYIGHVLSGKVKENENIFEASGRLCFDNQSSIIDHGFYYQHIQRYLRYFRREQMLTLIFDDMAKDPLSFIKEIYRFIGVDDAFVPSVIKDKINQSFKRSGLRTNMIRKLNQFGLLLHSIMPKTHHKFVCLVRLIRDRTIKRKGTEVPLSTRIELAKVYKEENDKLAEFLGRDLSFWK